VPVSGEDSPTEKREAPLPRAFPPPWVARPRHQRGLGCGALAFATQGLAEVCGNGHGGIQRAHPTLSAARVVIHVDPEKGFSRRLGPPLHVEAFDGEVGGAAEAEHLMDAPVLHVEEVVDEGASSAIGLAVGATKRLCEGVGDQ